MPDYHLLLQAKIELSESLQLVQQLLAGHIQPDSDWAAKHPREAEKLFVELLSDAVMAESLSLPGLLPDPDSVLSALAQKSGSSRLQKLHQHYQLWRLGLYDWYYREDEPLEARLDNLLQSSRRAKNQTLEALPWLEEPSSEIRRKVIRVDYSMIETSESEPSAMLDLWSRRFGLNLLLVGSLADILENLQLAREIPYPAMEAQQLLLLAEYLSKQGSIEQADRVLTEAREKVSGVGLKSLELKTSLALDKNDAWPDDSLTAEQTQEIQKQLEINTLMSRLKLRQFERAEPDLQRLIHSHDTRQAALALAIALNVGYPFARQVILDAIMSEQPERHRLAVDALSLMPAERLSQDEWSESRLAFKYQLSKSLLDLASRTNPDLQSRLVLVLPNELDPELLNPEGLRPFLLAKDERVILFGLRNLSFVSAQAVQALLPELTSLLTSSSFDILYATVQVLPDLPFEDLSHRLAPVLDVEDMVIWPLAWKKLAQSNSTLAKKRLTAHCSKASAQEHILACLLSRYAMGDLVRPDELIAAVREWPFESSELAMLAVHLTEPQTWAVLAQAAVDSEPKAQQRLLALLDNATFDLSLISQGEPVDPQIKKALKPIASLLKQSELLSRLLALNLWNKATGGRDLSVLKQALVSSVPAERALAISLLNWQRWASGSPVYSLTSQQIIDWLSESDQLLLTPDLELSPLAAKLQSGAEPLTWHSYLAGLMGAGDQSLPYTPVLVVTELYSLLKHPHASIRQIALGFLAYSGNPDHVEAIKVLLQDPELSVRSAAYEALVQLDKRIYLFYLEALKENLLPAAELEAYLSFIASDKIYRIELYQDEYVQILENPVHRQTLWRLAESTIDQNEKQFLIELLNTEFLDK